jgi:post-segregation antitoxin (ccd killing protein)
MLIFMSECEKLKHLLEHWIEHNREHVAKYEEWAEKIKNENLEVSRLIREAIRKFEEGEKLLGEAYRILRS